jgi:integrase
MAKVVKDARDGRWLARWRDPDGYQRKRSFPRRVDAERFLVALTAEQHRGNYLDPSAGKVTVAAWSSQWAGGLSHLKLTTLERYLGILRVHILPRWGRRSLASISHTDVAVWVADLSASGLAPGSVRQIYRVLSLLMDMAVLDGRLGRNPAQRVKLPRVRRGEPVFLSAEQVGRLVDAAGSDGTSIRVLALTGLRFGELAGLRVKRVDVVRRRLVVAEGLSEVRGQVVWSSPKTHQTRSVPVPRSLIAGLVELSAGKGPDDPVFTSPKGHPLRLTNWRPRVFDPACLGAGIVGVTPHDLRHTAASLAISAGANVKAVQRMLGHASAAMTLDVYAGLFSDDLDDVADRMDSLVPQTCHKEPNGDGTPIVRTDRQRPDLQV